MLLCQPGTAASDLSDQEIRGRALFLTGRTDEPAPYAAVGAGNVQLPATAVPCGSCHGRDGLGGAERGGWPPNITWPVLSAPDVTPGRTRPPYSETLVVRAVTMGIDAGGNRTRSGNAALPPVDGRCGGPACLHQASRHPARARAGRPLARIGHSPGSTRRRCGPRPVGLPCQGQPRWRAVWSPPRLERRTTCARRAASPQHRPVDQIRHYLRPAGSGHCRRRKQCGGGRRHIRRADDRAIDAEYLK